MNILVVKWDAFVKYQQNRRWLIHDTTFALAIKKEKKNKRKKKERNSSQNVMNPYGFDI